MAHYIREPRRPLRLGLPKPLAEMKASMASISRLKTVKRLNSYLGAICRYKVSAEILSSQP